MTRQQGAVVRLVLMCVAWVIGGMFTFVGPIVGAFVYELANHFLIQYTQDWQVVLGVVLLAIVLLRPDGLLYLGVPNIVALRTNTRFLRISNAGLRESHVHDVQITEEALNYPVGYTP